MESATSRPPASDRREQRALEDAVEDRAPDAGLALRLVAPLGHPRHAALLGPALAGRGRRASRGARSREPSTATATTRIVPMPNETNTALPARNMPAIAAMTVKPEISTARPEVAAAAFERGLASRGRRRVPPSRAAGRTSSSRRRPRDRRAGRRSTTLSSSGVELADRAEQADRAEHGGEAEQQRQAGGDERAERDQQDDQRDRERERPRPSGSPARRPCRSPSRPTRRRTRRVTSGCARWSCATAAERALDASLAASSSPGSSKVTSVEPPVLGDVALVALARERVSRPC